MIEAVYIGESPNIDIEKGKEVVNTSVTITISELVVSLDEPDAKELLDGLEESLIPWEETRSGLEKRIEELEQELEDTQARLNEYIEGCGER